MPRHALENHTHSTYADKEYIDRKLIDIKDITDTKITYGNDEVQGVVQLYLNQSKTSKAYPKTLCDQVYMLDGTKLTTYLSNNIYTKRESYNKNETNTLLNSIQLTPGPKGDDGSSIELKKTTTHIQWRELNGVWKDLITIAELIGPKGDSSDIDLTDYSTRAWVIEQIVNVGNGNQIDLSGLATKGELKTKADVVHQHSAENVEFTNNRIIEEQIGGIKVGENLKGLSLESIISKLLFKHFNHTISGNSTPNGGVYEKGSEQIVTALTAVVGRKTNPITNIEFYNNGNLIGSIVDNIENGGIFALPNLNIPVNSKSNFQIKVTANGESGNPLVLTSNTGEFDFIHPYYYGLSSSEDISESIIKRLDKKIEIKSDKVATVNSNFQKFIFAYPKSYGVISKIYDSNNFNIKKTFKITELNIQCLNNETTPYYVYSNSKFTANDFTFKFNY